MPASAKSLRLILGDQLSPSLSSLADCRPGDPILMVEIRSEATYAPHHIKRIAFNFSCQRHFAAELAAQGHAITYVKMDDPANTQNFTGEVARHCQAHGITGLIVTEPGEQRVLDMIRSWPDELNLAVELRPDDRFLASHDDFRGWAHGKQQLRMEYFYREMRRKHGVLLDEQGEPEGGRWNYDPLNRKGLKKNPGFRARREFAKDPTTLDVIALVEREFPGHFGTIEPFHLAVTRADALAILDDFIRYDLPSFGDYQDAMLDGEPFLYHAHISFYMNIGLLLPLECVQAAERAYRDRQAPLNAVEGFIRQILGWREFMRGIYWLKMPGYAALNFLDATRPLPAFYWTGETDLNCVRSTVAATQKWAYSHHIQRLMVTGNLALLAGFDVGQVCEWYLAVYGDAYEWVELPNTLGMSLFGDGGIVGSKPYAGSGNYINKQSDFCGKCRYDPKQAVGPDACPFNALYWNFLDRNRAKLDRNPRMLPMYRILGTMTDEKRQALNDQAAATLQGWNADPWVKQAR